MFMGKESNLSKTKLFPKAGSLSLVLPLKSRKEGGETPSHLVYPLKFLLDHIPASTLWIRELNGEKRAVSTEVSEAIDVLVGLAVA